MADSGHGVNLNNLKRRICDDLGGSYQPSNPDPDIAKMIALAANGTK
ncbi:MAG: hypothetical protein H0X08_02245 [Blastocatellia bacterium]|nr:hypothetical protein [Blastocatellia bacterium]